MSETAIAGPRRVQPGYLAFDEVDLKLARKKWKVNCGPAALAAICGLTLMEAFLAIRTFEPGGGTTIPQMMAALRRLDVPGRQTTYPDGFPEVDCELPGYGLVVVQFGGPWRQRGLPYRRWFKSSHFIALADGHVFDVNSGWKTLEEWKKYVVPLITGKIPGADGSTCAVWGYELFVEQTKL